MADFGRKTALIAGATGLVGARCLVRLLNHPAYSRVTALTRAPLPIAHERLLVELVDFDRLPALNIVHEDVFCCLGTTIKKAGSQQAFSRVDHDYPLAVAKIGKAAGRSGSCWSPRSARMHSRECSTAGSRARPSGILLQSVCRSLSPCDLRFCKESARSVGREKRQGCSLQG